MTALPPAPGADSLIEDKLAQFIDEIGIPPRPIILEQIAREARRDEPDFSHIAFLISRDVSLAGGLIKIANSPFFGYRQKAHNVQDALIMLGLNVATRAVAGLILKQALPVGPHLERFWDASDRIAQLSGWLSQNVDSLARISAEDAYTFGLFRDCGIPVLMRKFSNYPSVLEAANQDPTLCFTEVEEQHLPTNHAMVGALLAQSWWLPETTCLAIRHHHDCKLLNEEGTGLILPAQRLIAAGQLAEHLLQRLTGLSRTKEWEKLGAACMGLLGLDEAEIDALQVQAEGFLASLADK